MIDEDYCSYEVAKLLKEKGFNEPCIRHWDCDDHSLYGANDIPISNSELRDNEYNGFSAPTHQMAMKWLREEHWLHIVIQPMVPIQPSGALKWVADTFDISIFYKELSKFRLVAGTQLCDSPQKAVDTALKYTLENLI